jgi:hypothetical protein
MKEGDGKDRFAFAELTDAEVVTRGDGSTEIEGSYHIHATDSDTADEVVESIITMVEEMGGTASREKPDSGKGFYMGGKRWKANWQPTGPTPPWAQHPEEN